MKRQKTIFSSNEFCAHRWAHGVQSYGATGNKNLYFEGDTIFSYGSHYPIARKYTNGKTGADLKRFVLFNSNGSTMTTEGKHKNAVRSALRGYLDYIAVPYPTEPLHSENESYLLNCIAACIEYSLNSRVQYRSYMPDHLASCISDLNNYYGYTGQKKCFVLDDCTREIFNTLHNEKRDRDAKKEEAKRAARIAKDAALYSEFGPSYWADWARHAVEKSAPSHLELKHDYVRIKADGVTLETQRRAEVPLEIVKSLVARVDAGLKIQGLSAGGFRIDSEPSLDPEQIVKVGCHRISLVQVREVLALRG